jgi:shikimate kinase
MGSGKSKSGEALAKIFKIPFLDTDVLIENKTGLSISEIFELKGEESFRKIEQEVLHSTTSFDNIIVATGGGTPCFKDNMDWMNRNGITVYLEANAGLLFHRLAVSKAGRPLIEKLNDVELMEQISGTLAIRTPFYGKADITCKAASINVKELAEKIKDFKKNI